MAPLANDDEDIPPAGVVLWEREESPIQTIMYVLKNGNVPGSVLCHGGDIHATDNKERTLCVTQLSSVHDVELVHDAGVEACTVK